MTRLAGSIAWVTLVLGSPSGSVMGVGVPVGVPIAVGSEGS